MRTASILSHAPVAALTVAALLVATSPSPADAAPYGVSTVFAGVRFNTATFRHVAESAEGWPSTAAEDGTVYTA